MTSIILEIFLLEIGQTLRVKYYNSIDEYANIVFQFHESLSVCRKGTFHQKGKFSFIKRGVLVKCTNSFLHKALTE